MKKLASVGLYWACCFVGLLVLDTVRAAELATPVSNGEWPIWVLVLGVAIPSIAGCIGAHFWWVETKRKAEQRKEEELRLLQTREVKRLRTEARRANISNASGFSRKARAEGPTRPETFSVYGDPKASVKKKQAPSSSDIDLNRDNHMSPALYGSSSSSVSSSSRCSSSDSDSSSSCDSGSSGGSD